jgi:hypothetical protein
MIWIQGLATALVIVSALGPITPWSTDGRMPR